MHAQPDAAPLLRTVIDASLHSKTSHKHSVQWGALQHMQVTGMLMQQCWTHLLCVRLSLLLALEHHQLLSISKAQAAVGGLTAAGNLLPAIWRSHTVAQQFAAQHPAQAAVNLLSTSARETNRPKRSPPAEPCTKDVPHRLPQPGCCNAGGPTVAVATASNQYLRGSDNATTPTSQLHSAGPRRSCTLGAACCQLPAPAQAQQHITAR